MSTIKVGMRYKNSIGEYEVLSIEDRIATIRYILSGKISTNTVKWLEKGLPKSPKKDNPPPDLDGFVEDDFQKGTAGTHWRARDSVAGAVARRLTGLAGRPFQSYAIYRRAEVHIADPNRYDDTNKFPEAKFVIYLDHQCARYGFYVEKRDKPMDEKWDWLRFLASLKRQELQRKIWLAARERNLHWEIDIPVDGQIVDWIYVWPQETEFMWTWQENGQKQMIVWDELIAKLEGINGQTDRWCDVLVVASLSKEDALKEGAEIVERIARVYESLLPLYEACSK